MTEKPGHFEQGRWVTDKEPPAPQPAGDEMDKRLGSATKAVISSIDDVMNVARDLVTTDEGKQYIEKTLSDTQAQIQKSFDEIIGRAKEELEKNIKR
ncbi:hypothetical protein [uncultured Methanoregula sp.]|uniref:hypothetical protein n=1 Tax=uncultured Methanoregula sp. TaxID=1005933 RepID=UPI002AAAC86B|nr:hypothetical protein [uncultured Methanoregula sp.]